MAASSEQDGWVLRVLGLEVAPVAAGGAAAGGGAAKAPPAIGGARLAALGRKAGKLAGLGRPAEPPKAVATGKLLGAIGRSRAPEDPRQAAGHVAAFVPGFLAAIETERPATSRPLKAGETLGEQDQVLGMADLFASVQRSLLAWETLLAETEEAGRDLDALEAAEGRDEKAYAATLAAYGTLRKRSIAAEARAMPLMEALQARFNGLSADQQKTAAKEAARG